MFFSLFFVIFTKRTKNVRVYFSFVSAMKSLHAANIVPSNDGRRTCENYDSFVVHSDSIQIRSLFDSSYTEFDERRLRRYFYLLQCFLLHFAFLFSILFEINCFSCIFTGDGSSPRVTQAHIWCKVYLQIEFKIKNYKTDLNESKSMKNYKILNF